MENEETILNFIKRHKIAVIATSDLGGNPEAAVIEFGETDGLELIFDTLKTSRKYKNLIINNKVAFVIGWDEAITVQYEGLAIELKDEDRERYRDIYFAKNPKARRWSSNPDITYFKVLPIWIRYSNLNKNPWDVLELDLNSNS